MRLGLGTKISYGIGGVADNAMYNFAASFLLFYLTIVVGIAPAAAGFIAAMGAVWEAVLGPIVGYLSDGTNSKYGKRKPFLMIAAAPVALSTGLLFTYVDFPYSLKLIYYGIMVLVFWTTFAMFFVPYMAWGSDLTSDYNERTVLRSYTYVFYQIGMAMGIVMPTVIVDLLMDRGYTEISSWSYVGFFVGLVSMISLLICSITIKDESQENINKNEGKILTFIKLKEMYKSYLKILKLKAIRYLIIASVLFLVSNIIFSSGRVYYYTYNLGLSGSSISKILFVITVSGILFVPFINHFAKKHDKNRVFLWGQVITGLSFILFRIIGIDTYLAAIMMGIVFSVANSCYWQLMPSMIYDVCEVEQLNSGSKHSASVISLQALAESLASALGLQILGLVLQLHGFEPEAMVQSQDALLGVMNSFTLYPGILMLLVALIILKYPVNRETFNRVISALEHRKKGMEVDLNQFKDIL